MDEVRWWLASLYTVPVYSNDTVNWWQKGHVVYKTPVPLFLKSSSETGGGIKKREPVQPGYAWKWHSTENSLWCEHELCNFAIKEAGFVESGWTTLSADVRLDYKSCTVWPKITEDGNSLQDKQWTPTGAGPMVPEEEEEQFVIMLMYATNWQFVWFYCKLVCCN